MKFQPHDIVVLILVVMDNSLVQITNMFYNLINQSLNPCCNGQ